MTAESPSSSDHVDTGTVHPSRSAAAMRISSVIPRLTDPRLLTINLPAYRHSFSLPLSPSAPSEGEGTKPGAGEARYMEWDQLLPTPSRLISSFGHLFRNPLAPSAQPTAPAPPPRLVFFGEQHHQPHALRAQLQTLHALHSQCRTSSQPIVEPPASAVATRTTLYRLHLVLEHFSVSDQRMLSDFSSGKLTPQELMEEYRAKSEEGFRLDHYMSLLMLARELQVPIWGGFPPRSWAKDMFREGIDVVKGNEEQRVQHATSSEHPQAPRFTDWSIVTNMNAAHRSYLSSLMRPDLPPRFPELPQPASEDDGVYPTWLLEPTAPQTKGFAPAQALKDSYLAHTTAWILRPAPPPVINVALVICGLGHCEYGFGAPERVVHLMRNAVKPYIIASKPADSGIWMGREAEEKSPTAGWQDDPWQRRLADAVLLYDWIDEDDEEPVPEPVQAPREGKKQE